MTTSCITPPRYATNGVLDLIPPLMAATRDHALAIGSADRHEVHRLSEAKDAAQHALQAAVYELAERLADESLIAQVSDLEQRIAQLEQEARIR